MKRALLDINVLLALAWPNHQHHAPAHRWFAQEGEHGWATCEMTQLGFVRLSSNPAFTSAAVSPTEPAELLQEMISRPEHRFWASAGIERPGIFRSALSHQQVNDAFLVALAQKHKGQVVTFDRRLSAHANSAGQVQALLA
jgi:hypothetical protein